MCVYVPGLCITGWMRGTRMKDLSGAAEPAGAEAGRKGNANGICAGSRRNAAQ